MSVGAKVNCAKCGKPAVLPLPFANLDGVSQPEIIDALARTQPDGWAAEGSFERGGRKILCPACRTPASRPAGPENLSPFVDDPACPACGSRASKALAVPAEVFRQDQTPVFLREHKVKYCEGDSFQKTCPAGGGPHLHYACHRCGRAWATACKGGPHG